VDWKRLKMSESVNIMEGLGQSLRRSDVEGVDWVRERMVMVMTN
jgi:hypothetical protein